ncbi:hypothetical protein O3P69_019004 [Scylla paramamosain]|uniref:Uncharacterized protein n=1 Tax=Scylla paramamosain TaxID=85552 RepID=A0AAW0SBB4_SCYPA
MLYDDSEVNTWTPSPPVAHLTDLTRRDAIHILDETATQTGGNRVNISLFPCPVAHPCALCLARAAAPSRREPEEPIQRAAAAVLWNCDDPMGIVRALAETYEGVTGVVVVMSSSGRRR